MRLIFTIAIGALLMIGCQSKFYENKPDGKNNDKVLPSGYEQKVKDLNEQLVYLNDFAAQIDKEFLKQIKLVDSTWVTPTKNPLQRFILMNEKFSTQITSCVDTKFISTCSNEVFGLPKFSSEVAIQDKRVDGSGYFLNLGYTLIDKAKEEQNHLATAIMRATELSFTLTSAYFQDKLQLDSDHDQNFYARNPSCRVSVTNEKGMISFDCNNFVYSFAEGERILMSFYHIVDNPNQIYVHGDFEKAGKLFSYYIYYDQNGQAHFNKYEARKLSPNGDEAL